MLKYLIWMTLFTTALNGRAVEDSNKTLYKQSMENDALLIESVANHFLAVAQLQRVILDDLKWKPRNAEWKKINSAVVYFKKSKGLLAKAFSNTEKLKSLLEGEKKEKFAVQIETLKSRTGDMEKMINQIVQSIEKNEKPSDVSIHQLTKSMVGIIGYGIEVSKKNNQ